MGSADNEPENGIRCTGVAYRLNLLVGGGKNEYMYDTDLQKPGPLAALEPVGRTNCCAYIQVYIVNSSREESFRESKEIPKNRDPAGD